MRSWLFCASLACLSLAMPSEDPSSAEEDNSSRFSYKVVENESVVEFEGIDAMLERADKCDVGEKLKYRSLMVRWVYRGVTQF